MAGTRQLAASLLVALISLLSLQTVAADDESILTSEIGRLNNQSLLWGPYRPNLYFGIRPRLPKSLMAGLLWVKVDSYTDVQNRTVS